MLVIGVRTGNELLRLWSLIGVTGMVWVYNFIYSSVYLNLYIYFFINVLIHFFKFRDGKIRCVCYYDSKKKKWIRKFQSK